MNSNSNDADSGASHSDAELGDERITCPHCQRRLTPRPGPFNGTVVIPTHNVEVSGLRGFSRRCSTAGLGVMVSLCILVGLDDPEHETARLCTGGIPADTGNSHFRFDNTPSIALNESNYLI